MKKYDFIIIGSGISCLYFLKKVKEANLNLKIAILEKKPFAGGRISSINIKKDTFDSGALRITNNHKLVLQLLKEYGITDVLELNNDIKISDKLLSKFKKFLKDVQQQKYQKFAFGEIAKSHFPMDEYEKLRVWFGYDQKWEETNCQYLAKVLLSSYNAKKYFYVKLGLSQLVDAMFNELKNDFDFFLGEKAIKIAEGNNIYTMNNKHFTAEHIIFACPPHYIKNIQGTDELIPLLAGVGGQILNRIYAKFKDNSWFPKTVLHSFKPVCQTVPISENIIMISYSTNRDAKYWIQREIDGTLWKTLKEDLELKDVDKPVWIKQNYWNPGTHYWKPGFDPEKTQLLSFKPLLKRNWHIIGEAFSMHQGWMEGALENAALFFKKYSSNKLQMKDKVYTLQEVARHNQLHDAWIAVHGNVYDVTNWIHIHPGGDVIKYGIGKDATDMFKSVGHQEDALEFINEYKIGILI